MLVLLEGTRHGQTNQKMTEVLQGNINETILANTLLEQWIAKEAPDVLLLSEPYRNRNDRRWIANADGRAAVWVPSGRPITRQGTGQDHVLATVANTTFVSVYLSPNLSAGDFDTRKLSSDRGYATRFGKVETSPTDNTDREKDDRW